MMDDESSKKIALGGLVLEQMKELEKLESIIPDWCNADGSSVTIELRDGTEWTISVKKNG